MAYAWESTTTRLADGASSNAFIHSPSLDGYSKGVFRSLELRWDAVRARHLLNRATFAAKPAEIERALSLGLHGTVRALLAGSFVQTGADVPSAPPIDFAGLEEMRRGANASKGDSPLGRELRKEYGRKNNEALQTLRTWWLRRMIDGPDPFREKLTLFWHGHFATSVADVGSARLMWLQNAFLRQHALSDLRTLLVGIARDPAMLRYLDNDTNRKEHPNENFARELMELFTMGVGHYTEDDVQHAARAFTGWGIEDEAFKFRPRWHDDGAKQFLGRVGNFDGTDIIEIILAQPATSRFIAKKLYAYYVQDDPPEAAIEHWGGVFRESGHSVRPFLEALFTSDDFYRPEVMGTQIKSPVQLVVGSMQLLAPPGWEAADLQLFRFIRAMGQELFAPPNVKGWDGGTAWISTATIATREQFADFLARGAAGAALGGKRAKAGEPPAKRGTWLDALLSRAGDPRSSAQAVDGFASLLIGAPPPAALRASLARLFPAPGDSLDPERPEVRQGLVAVLAALMKLPEYQLC